MKENLKITIAKIGLWRGHPKGEENITHEVLRSIKEHFERRGVEVPIDFEHESLENKKAPAVGWISQLEIKDDELIATPRWSEEARELIKNGAYKYVSPVFIFDAIDEQSGEKLPAVLHSVALTNTPFMSQLGEIKANKTNKFKKGESMQTTPKKPDALQNSADEQSAQITQLQAENEALKLENNELKERIKELEAQLSENVKKAAEEAVANSLAAGKISHEQLAWANSYARKDLEGFKEFLKHARSPQILENNILVSKQSNQTIADLIAGDRK